MFCEHLLVKLDANALLHIFYFPPIYRHPFGNECMHVSRIFKCICELKKNNSIPLFKPLFSPNLYIQHEIEQVSAEVPALNTLQSLQTWHFEILFPHVDTHIRHIYYGIRKHITHTHSHNRSPFSNPVRRIRFISRHRAETCFTWWVKWIMVLFKYDKGIFRSNIRRR